MFIDHNMARILLPTRLYRSAVVLNNFHAAAVFVFFIKLQQQEYFILSQMTCKTITIDKSGK
jgi:hypothetical protein